MIFFVFFTVTCANLYIYFSHVSNIFHVFFSFFMLQFTFTFISFNWACVELLVYNKNCVVKIIIINHINMLTQQLCLLYFLYFS